MACTGTTLPQVCRAINISNGRYTLSDKLSDFIVWRYTLRKNWVSCAVLTGNCAGLRNVFSSHLSHRELHCSPRESNSFLSLPADTTTASSQGTQFIQQMSIAWYIPFQMPLLTPHFTLFFLFSDNIMADVASKQQTTALFLSTVVTHTRRHTEMTKNWQTW